MLMMSLLIGGAKNSFWNRGGFPPTAVNGSGGEEVVVQDPWEGRPNVAPFDQGTLLLFLHIIFID